MHIRLGTDCANYQSCVPLINVGCDKEQVNLMELEFFEESLDFLKKHAELIHTFEKWEVFRVYLTNSVFLTIVEPANDHYWTFDFADPKDRHDVKRIFEYLGFQELFMELLLYATWRKELPDLAFREFINDMITTTHLTLYAD